MARRSVLDPLEPTKEPRRYTVRNMHGGLLEGRLLAAGSDLKRAFVAEMLQWIDAGWQLGEFSSTGGVFFCTRGTEWSMVWIRRAIRVTCRIMSPRVGRGVRAVRTEIWPPERLPSRVNWAFRLEGKPSLVCEVAHRESWR